MLNNVPQLSHIYTVSFIGAYVFCCNGSGPNALTLPDFIQMIWDQKPPVVVMLTRLFEKGKVAKYTIYSDNTMSIVMHLQNCILTM